MTGESVIVSPDVDAYNRRSHQKEHNDTISPRALLERSEGNSLSAPLLLEPERAGWVSPCPVGALALIPSGFGEPGKHLGCTR